jgi:SAM-dependent methyltransferase
VPAAESDCWDGDRAARWVRQSAGLEKQLAPVSAHLLAAAGLTPGQRVLDVGCGTGPTTRDAAVAVGPTGRVTGLDVSQDMLDAAAAVPAAAGAAPMDWLRADAAAWTPPDPPAYDVVLSRFGVMFFSNPAAAFANLARATHPGGRLAIAVWDRRDASELFTVPLRAALDAMARHGVTPEVPAEDDGAFSLHDAAAVGELLTGAGWSGVDVTAYEVALPFGGGLPAREAAVSSLEVGPTRIVTTGLADDIKDAVVDAITEAFAPFDRGEGVVLDGSIRIVRAART